MAFHRPVRSLVRAVIVAAAVAPAGCSTPSLWETGYAGSSAAPLAPGTPVQVRKVAFERVQITLNDLESAGAVSDVHPEDWTVTQKADARAKLLRGLQVSEDPASITILGRADFRTTAPPRTDGPDAPALTDFARRIGANRVAWTNSYLGKTDTIVREPVTTWTDGTTWPARRDDKHRTPNDYHETSTTWVPIRVQADEYAFIAYFLRDAVK